MSINEEAFPLEKIISSCSALSLGRNGRIFPDFNSKQQRIVMMARKMNILTTGKKWG
jgi:hypothetical protein